MDTNNLKHVVGELSQGAPAIIRFFEAINCESAQRFNDEFLYLQNTVKPSKIIVLINSEGGSVMYGMGMYAIIRSCPIEVDCVIEGLAASMASVLWAAGNNSYMHDYSILMIHNPFLVKGGSYDENTQNIISAFRKQLETLYHKRFGLSEAKVKAIMDGGQNVDGTYLTAQDAVDAGIIPSKHIIKTSKQICNQVKNAIKGLTDIGDIRGEMAKVTSEVDENKLPELISSIPNQNELLQQRKLMAEKDNFSFGAVAAQLGFDDDAPIVGVTGRITELLNAEASLVNVRAELADLKIKYQGKETEVTNVQIKLSGIQAELDSYKNAEKAAKETAIEEMVGSAITAGKIEASAKENWIVMAKTNFELTRDTLNSIPERDKISDVIGKDDTNIANIQGSIKSAEQLMEEKVVGVLGENAKLKKF